MMVLIVIIKIEQVKMARENWKNNLHKSQNHYFRAGVTIKY